MMGKTSNAKAVKRLLLYVGDKNKIQHHLNANSAIKHKVAGKLQCVVQIKDIVSQANGIRPTRSLQRSQIPYRCKHCKNPKYFDNFDRYRRHSKRHQRGSDSWTKLWQRQHNILSKRKQNSRNDYVTISLQEQVKDVAGLSFQCTLCNENFPDIRGLLVHKKKFHSNLKLSTCKARCIDTQEVDANTSSQQQGVQFNNITDLSFSCTLCNENFLDIRGLLAHKKKFHFRLKLSTRNACCTDTLDGSADTEGIGIDTQKVNKDTEVTGIATQEVNLENIETGLDTQEVNLDTVETGLDTQEVKVDTENTTSSNLQEVVQCMGCSRWFPSNKQFFKCSSCPNGVSQFHSVTELQNHKEEYHDFKEDKFRCSDCKVWYSTDTLFRCKTCPCEIFQFHCNDELEKHTRDWHDKLKLKGYHCRYCRSWSRTPQGIAQHEIVHSRGSFLCYDCNKWYPIESCIKCELCGEGVFQCHTDSELKQHEQEPFHKDWASKHVCKDCGKVYLSECKLDKHQIRKRHYQYKYLCTSCDKWFLISSHPKLPCLHCADGTFFHSEDEREKHDAEFHRYPCTQCTKIFVRHNLLRRHELRHQKERLKCEHCPLTFAFRWQLLQHHKDVKYQRKQRQTRKDFECVSCKRSFPDLRSLLSHRRESHPLLKPCKCNQCGIGFKSRSQLLYHKLTNHYKSKNRCNICSVYCQSKVKLMRHKRAKHNEDSIFGCKYCSQSFTQKKFLDQHMKQDHPEHVSYKCRFCEVLCPTPNQLQYHMDKIHLGPFPCRYCNHPCKTRKSLGRHEARHKSDKTYKCKLCLKVFSFAFQLRAHEAQEHDVRPYRCPHCETALSHKSGLRRHLIHVHGRTDMSGYQESAFKPFQCQSCDASFKLRKMLETHQEKVHEDHEPYMCSKCNMSFKTIAGINRHERQHANYKQFNCVKCSKAFSKEKYFAAHMKLHTTGERPFKCSQCPSAFIVRNHLQQHEKIHLDGVKPYQCEQCGAAFQTNWRLTRHKKTHTFQAISLSLFGCNECKASFPTNARLNRHKKTHENLRKDEKEKFQCTECDKVFPEKYRLNRHGQIHRKDKAGRNIPSTTFKCDKCGKVFPEKYRLTRHAQIHMKEKTDIDYPCDKCGKVFPTNGRLKRHTEIHKSRRRKSNKTFECHECGSEFPTKARLNRHAQIHLETKPYICETCGKGFAARTTLVKHAEKNHMDK